MKNLKINGNTSTSIIEEIRTGKGSEFISDRLLQDV
jgi:hypothetical protein